MAGTIEVHLFGFYTVVFVLCDSVRVDMDANITSSFEAEGLSRGAFLYLEVGTGHVSHVGRPPDIT